MWSVQRAISVLFVGILLAVISLPLPGLSASLQTKRCPKGHTNEAKRNFCKVCGAKLASSAAQPNRGKPPPKGPSVSSPALPVVTRLTNNQLVDQEPAAGLGWILFSSKRGGPDYDIYLMDMEGKGVRPLTSASTHEFAPAFAYDGRIAFTANEDFQRSWVCVMALDGSGQHPVEADRLDAWDPSWSPDGSRLAFSTNRFGGKPEICTIKVDGTDLRRLTNNDLLDREPSWGPDGRIAYVSSRGRYEEIRVMGSDGTNDHRASPSSEWDCRNPAWTRDGRIVFWGSRGGGLSVMNSDGSKLRKLTNDGFNPSCAPDGTVVFERWIVDTGSGGIISEIFRLKLPRS